MTLLLLQRRYICNGTIRFNRFFSASHAVHKVRPVRILYGSQGGTAKIFAMTLQQELEEVQGCDTIPLLSLDDPDALQPDALHVIMCAVAGVGEPPDNAKQFYNKLVDETIPKDELERIQYTVFGLGNSVAHPNHYNIIGKTVDSKLQELGAERVYPLGLGDDGECIEDDFDLWMQGLLSYIQNDDSKKESAIVLDEVMPSCTATSCNEFVPKETMRPSISLKCEEFNGSVMLETRGKNATSVYHNLLDASFYEKGATRLKVVANVALGNAGEQGMRELQLQLPPNVSYETGDHIIIYPRNSECMVNAFLEQYPQHDHYNSIIVDGGVGYPHPTGISIYDTLSHCVDLGAVPSPALARYLLQEKDINYKNDIASPRKTVLELLRNGAGENIAPSPPPLLEMLRQLPKMQPRYYSIASSSKVHPNMAYITFRPVKYMTTAGHLREGVCTSYMLTTAAAAEDEESFLVAAIRSNSTFRLPSNPQVPVIFVAGGCGIAPIRAFLEERVCINGAAAGTEMPLCGDSMVFLGFRSPSDVVYEELIHDAATNNREKNSLVCISYSNGCESSESESSGQYKCRLVSESVRDHGDVILDWMDHRGAHLYLCGGARGFGAALRAELMHLLQSKQGLSVHDATERLQHFIAQGRLCEDLA